MSAGILGQDLKFVREMNRVDESVNLHWQAQRTLIQDAHFFA